jgi:predicted nucleotidyltransferase
MKILIKGGCTDIFLFGSLAQGQSNPTSDIDLAIRGCPKGQFFYLYGQLLRQLHHKVDLVNLDSLDPFGHYLEETGELYQLV